MPVYRYSCALFVCLVFLLTGCGGPPSINQENKATAEVVVASGDDGFSLAIEPLYDRLVKTTLVPQGGKVDSAAVREHVDSLLLDTLTGLAAQDVNIRDYYLDYWSYRLRYNDFLVSAFFDNLIRYKIETDSAEIRQFYEDNKEAFSYPEQVELYHILVTESGLLQSDDSSYYKSLDEATLDSAVEAYARSLYDSIQAGTDFGEIAFRYSHDEISNKKFGYIGWTRRGQYIDPFDSIAFSMDVPSVSEPYQDRDGWHILMIEDYLPEGPVALEREGVWDGVKETLVRSRVDSLSRILLDSLLQDVTYEYNEALLDTITFDVHDSLWAAVVNDLDTIDFRYLKQAEQNFTRRFRVPSATPDQKKLLLQEVAVRFVIARAANTLGVDTIAYVREERDRLRFLTAKSILEADRFDPAWRPDDSTLEAYYRDNPQLFHVEQPFRIAQIVVNDSVLAVYLRDLAASGYDFPSLVDEYIPDGEGFTGRYEEIGWVGPNDVDSAIYSAALATASGNVSRPAKTAEGWHLVKVLDHRRSQTYVEAKGAISVGMVRRYRREAIQAALNELIARYGIVVNEDLPDIYLLPVKDRHHP